MKENAKKISYYGVGFQNWILIIGVLCTINFGLGNWKYKIILDNFTTPNEYIGLFVHYIRSHFRPFVILLLCAALQAILSLIIEKALINNYVSESTGLAFHVINSVLPTNFTLTASHLVYMDPCTIFLVMVHVVHVTFLREISFTLVNSRLRKEWRKSLKETSDKNKEDIKNIYPHNINLKDTLLFWLGTPCGTYRPEAPHVFKLNFVWLVPGLVKTIISTYISLNILYVLIAPEVRDCVQYIESGAFFEAFKCYMRLLIPVHFVWLIGIYYFTLVAISGTWCKIVEYRTNKPKDWWNSTTMSEFWTKWNYFVHEWYRETVFIPLVNSGISVEYATIAIFACSGLLHVFFIELPFRIYNGGTFLGMLFQIPQNNISSYLKNNYGPRISNCYVLLQFIIFHPLFDILFYYNYNSLNKN